MNKELEAIEFLNRHRNAYYNDNGYMKDLANAINDILPEYVMLRERDEPMKVDLKTKYALPYSGTYYECPKCGKTAIGRYYNYCPDCGQKLDWSLKNGTSN